jgi:hypothetical protein
MHRRVFLELERCRVSSRKIDLRKEDFVLVAVATAANNFIPRRRTIRKGRAQSLPHKEKA